MKNVNLSYQPWVYGIVFTLSNAILVYGKLSVVSQMWVVLFGVVLPFLFAVITAPPLGLAETPSHQKEMFSAAAPGWKWAGFFLITVFLVTRCAKLGTPARWLGQDDALMALYTLPWLQAWHWKAFVTLGQDASTLSHFCFVVFKLTHSIFLSYQLPPIIISGLTVWLGFITSREYFSKSISFLILFLFVLSDWPMEISWPLLPGIVMPLWVCLFFYVLARFQKTRETTAQKWLVLCVGCVLGLGPYTFFAWPMFFLWGIVLALRVMVRKTGRTLFYFGLMTLGIGLGMAPFLAGVIQENYGGYLLSILEIGKDFGWVKRLSMAAEYFSVLVWGGEGSWAPVRGGFLNLFLASAFFIGWIELIRCRRLFPLIYLTAALVLLLVPGILSHDIETHRILLLLPGVLAVTAIGIQALFLKVPMTSRVLWLVLFLGVSAFVDLSRANMPLNWKETPANTQNERLFSYGILKTMADQKGPGLLFNEMIPNTKDYSLTYCTYGFNAALNPELSPEKAQWTAIFTVNHYVPWLRKRFPELECVNLPTSDKNVSSSHVLVWMPITNVSRPAFLKWVEFQRFQFRNDFEVIDTPSGYPLKKSLEHFLDYYSSVSNDPFLQSCYFERMSFLYSSEKSFFPQDNWTSWERFSPVFYASFDHGYQNIFLCEWFAKILRGEGKISESRRIFKEALKMSPGNQWLEYELGQTTAPAFKARTF
ncbi:MAG TPA: hypothetical protein VK791_03605 [bacterium]|nr:hypothetical protein [bacterium]